MAANKNSKRIATVNPLPDLIAGKSLVLTLLPPIGGSLERKKFGFYHWERRHLQKDYLRLEQTRFSFTMVSSGRQQGS